MATNTIGTPEYRLNPVFVWCALGRCEKFWGQHLLGMGCLKVCWDSAKQGFKGIAAFRMESRNGSKLEF